MVTDIAVTGGDPRYGLDIYLRMRRTFGTRVVETIERLLPFFVRTRDKDPTLQPFLDCQSTAIGENIISVSGLAHLAGATVRVVSNLGDHGTTVVDVNGAIDIEGGGCDPRCRRPALSQPRPPVAACA